MRPPIPWESLGTEGRGASWRLRPLQDLKGLRIQIGPVKGGERRGLGGSEEERYVGGR